MVGLARILAIEPDAPRRLLAGQPTAHLVKPITTGLRAIDRLGLLEISWYTCQLRRIGRGEAPRPDESGLWVLARQAWHMAMAGKRPGLPGRLRAS